MTAVKKILRSIILSFLTVFLLLNSQPSKAAIGVVFGGAGLVTAGLYAAGGGVAVAATGFGACFIGIDQTGTGHGPGCQVSLWAVIGGVVAGALGLLILEEEQIVAFSPLDSRSAQKIGITTAEMNAFNAEIDEVNMLAAHVDHELSRMEKPGIEESKSAWLEVKDAVSADTFSAMQKISAQIHE